MNNLETLRKQVYDNASFEYTVFIDDLKKQSPNFIISRAGEVLLKKEILAVIEKNLSEKTLKALSNLDSPLSALYNSCLEYKDGFISDNREILFHISELIADKLKYRQEIEANKKSNNPLYNKNRDEAEECGELVLWVSEANHNFLCEMDLRNIFQELPKDINKSINGWINKYGLNRCRTLLASHITWFSANTNDFKKGKEIEYASKVPIPNDTYSILSFKTNLTSDNLSKALECLKFIENERNRNKVLKSKKQSEPER